MNRHLSLAARSVVTFAITAILAFWTWRTVFGMPATGWLFRHPEAISVEYRNPTHWMTTAFPTTINEYNSTNLTVLHGPIQQAPFIGNYTNVIYLTVREGFSDGEIGNAEQLVSNLAPCYEGGQPNNLNCNTTDKRADFAYLVMNEKYVGRFSATACNTDPVWCWSLPEAMHAQLHEMGHVVGMAHHRVSTAHCQTPSLMRPGMGDCKNPTRTPYSTAILFLRLQDVEKDFINDNY